MFPAPYKIIYGSSTDGQYVRPKVLHSIGMVQYLPANTFNAMFSNANISLLKYSPYIPYSLYIKVVLQTLSNIDGHCCPSQVMDGLTYKFQFVLLKHHKPLQLFSWTDKLWHFITAESGIVARPDVRSIPWSNYPGPTVFCILAGTI